MHATRVPHGCIKSTLVFSVDWESSYSLGGGDSSDSLSQRLASWDEAHYLPTASVGCRTGPSFFADSHTEATLSYCYGGLSLSAGLTRARVRASGRPQELASEETGHPVSLALLTRVGCVTITSPGGWGQDCEFVALGMASL